MNRRELLQRLAQGHVQNVPFADLVDLAEGFGFRQDRVSGSHHIFRHAHEDVRLNLQPNRGEAKPYQIRQLLKAVEEFNLTLEGEP